MSQSIVTLGIGGTSQLTWFVTSGLHTDVEFAVYTVALRANPTPTTNAAANPSPSANLRSNPSPTEEMLSG